MHTRHTDKELYFREQVYTTETYVIPFIEERLKIDKNVSVLEVGCGEGGNLKPFLDRGCKVTGVDLSESKIEHAREFLGAHENASKLTLFADDIYRMEGKLPDSFQLIFLRDVIEHIHDQAKFMDFIRKYLSDGGVIFFGFPPWYNPFGGHQQICQNRILSKLPYFHILPRRIYEMILKAGGEPRERIDGLLEIKETGISIERFEKTYKRYGYRTVQRTMYFINPNYQVKFGLQPRKQNRLISAIPFIRNFLVTSCYYLLDHPGRGAQN